MELLTRLNTESGITAPAQDVRADGAHPNVLLSIRLFNLP
jgi:hypothetical protein